MGEITGPERELKKKHIEILNFMGFKKGQIATIVNLNVKTVSGMISEISHERLKELRPIQNIPLDIINQHKRLLEEAWRNYQSGDKKEVWFNNILNALSSNAEKLEKYGYINTEPERLDVTSKGEKINETQLINLINKVKQGDK